MVMVEDTEGRVLIQNKKSKSWGGLVFPGGHVESGEFFTDAAVREVREESGLTVLDPTLVGVKQFLMPDYRYVVHLYRATRFTGVLTSSDEGEVFFIPKDELLKRKGEMPVSFDRMLDMFFGNIRASEHCMYPDPENEGEWIQAFK